MSTYNFAKNVNIRKTKKRKRSVENPSEADSGVDEVTQKTTKVLDEILDQYVVKEDKILEENDASEPQRVKKKLKEKQLLKRTKIRQRKKNSLPPKHPDAEERTIFVGNVSVDLKRRQVDIFFSKYGKVESVRFRGFAVDNLDTRKKEAITQNKLHPERKSLIAYVRFEERASKEKALEGNGEVLGGLHIRVDSATDGVRKEKNSVFVGNLPWEIEDEDLWTLFKDCGKIKNVRIVRSAMTGAGKGIGFVSFESPDGVDLALNFDKAEVRRRRIRVSKAIRKMKWKPELKSSQKKGGTHSLVQGKKKQKMKMSFMKQDKPGKGEGGEGERGERRGKRGGKKGGAKMAKKEEGRRTSTNSFIGKKVVEDGRQIKKPKRTKRTKEEIKKFAFSKILTNTK